MTIYAVGIPHVPAQVIIMRKLTFLFSPLLLITLLFPALAYGVDVKFEDLVGREGLYYKKFTEVPFTGKVTGSIQGSIKDGKWDGPWVGYYANGPLLAKGTMKDGIQDGPWVGYHSNGQSHYRGTLKDGKRDGPWFSYNEDGTVDEKYTGTFKNGVKVK